MRPFLFLAKSSLVLSLVAAQMSHATAQTPSPAVHHSAHVPESAVANWRAMLDKYCITCHNERLRTGGLMLDRIDLTRVPDQAELWEKVVRKLHAGAMPPVGLPRPDRATSDGFATWLEAKLDAAATGDPGPAGLRRLNRSEYAAAVRDLLALDVDAGALLPADDANHGFDNMSDALQVSPALLEGYMSAARKISRLAVGDSNVTPAFSTYRVRADLGQDHHIEGLPLGTRGGLAVEVNFPLNGEYVFQPKLAVDTSAKVRGLDFEHQVVITVDGKTVHDAAVGGSKDEEAAAISPSDSEVGIRSRLEGRVAGERWAAPSRSRLREKKTSALPDGLLQPFERTNFDTQEQRGVPFLESLSIGGPFNASGPGDTPSRRKIFICRPEHSGEETACAKKILTELTKRAYRRPVTDTDIETPLSFYQTAMNAAPAGSLDAGFDAGIESALTFILTSPEFLFRVEADSPRGKPGDKPGTSSGRVGDLELASRLSFFLWSSIPDDELMKVAAHGKLSDPLVLEKQVRRMLADPRSDALATNFAAQWLYLRNLRGMSRDFATFPNFDDNLRQGFEHETELFFESIVHEDRSVLDLLRANYTFVNERLAKHYGIPGVYGSEFRRVTLPGDERRGLLGQGSVLAVTSYATRTSPVHRGKWLLENILGTQVPPPPPGVPALAENHSGLRARSVRERMEEHRKNPACASCHNIMDPLGFSLENFDAVGAWRERSESGAPIDASGKLVDGTVVDGPVSLRNALLARSGAFTQTLTEKLMTYAIGRGVEYYDMPAVRSIVRASAPGDYRFSSLILGIVRSSPFQMRRTEIAKTPAARQEVAMKVSGNGKPMRHRHQKTPAPAAPCAEGTLAASGRITAAGFDGPGADRPKPDRGPRRAAFGVRVRASRRNHAALHSCQRRRELCIQPDPEPSRSAAGAHRRGEQPGASHCRQCRRAFAQPSNVVERRASRRKRRQHSRRYHDRPDRRRNLRPGNTVSLVGTRHRRSLKPDRRLRWRLQLHLHQHAFLAHADRSVADGNQSPCGFRAPIRRRRHTRGAARPNPAGSQHSRRGDPAGQAAQHAFGRAGSQFAERLS